MDAVKYIVRYGAMRIHGIFTFSASERLRHGDRVIVRTERGLEAGVVLRVADVDLKLDAEVESDLDSEVEVNVCGGESADDRVLRLMTLEDEDELRRIRELERVEFIQCRKIIQQMNIVMDLVRVERIFDNGRLIVYYVAEGRVDFRELVKLLAAEFQTRIEMRQIGVRDETRLLADFGDCGLEVCCNLYLNGMLPVSMKMAKLQKATLDPNKVSGRCGRLKCCLRYEYDHYLETQKNLPPIGADVTTAAGDGKVVAHELLANKVLVEIPELGRKFFCPLTIKIKSDVIKIKIEDENEDENENEV
ncbi:MAG: signal peptidase [Planctomycetaceae bacterium]|jgi:cell fate regulator YaaT (PSP1 superfamily)|nr:signal peptidase [Planctomycetaceae bacterium]